MHLNFPFSAFELMLLVFDFEIERCFAPKIYIHSKSISFRAPLRGTIWICYENNIYTFWRTIINFEQHFGCDAKSQCLSFPMWHRFKQLKKLLAEQEAFWVMFHTLKPTNSWFSVGFLFHFWNVVFVLLIEKVEKIDTKTLIFKRR